MRSRFGSLIPLLTASLVLAACTSGGAGSSPPGGVPGQQQSGQPTSYPRNETLFTSGTQCGARPPT
jgi:peptide/nickel transport system substrate-binding protein